MQNIGEMMSEIRNRINKVTGGTVCFDTISTPTAEERALRDADRLNHERGALNESDGYECEKCLNRGFIYGTNGPYIIRKDCSCMKARTTIRRMVASGLQKVIEKYTFEKYTAETDWQKHVKELALDFVSDESPKWFFIGGQSGCGKSHICTAICRRLLAKAEVHYMMWEEESVQLKSMVTDTEAYQKHVDDLKNVSVLYIDDFFGGKRDRNGVASTPSPADIRLAREVLNHRYINGATTIISSEWYCMEIFDIDAAIGGRIIEMSGQNCLNIGRSDDRNIRLKLGGGIT